MGHRLSKIYTRTGDGGTTGLADGSRVSKDDARIEAIGALDETNSAVGMVLAQHIVDPAIRMTLVQIQHRLFDAGAQLSMPGYDAITDAHSTELEAALDKLNENLPPLKEFILPGGNASAAACHIARAAARQAERRILTLARNESVADSLRAWINRLSDYLFVAARALARQEGGSESLWQQNLERPAE